MPPWATIEFEKRRLRVDCRVTLGLLCTFLLPLVLVAGEKTNARASEEETVATGRATDAGGRPIEGATIRVLALSEGGQQVVTDGDGRFQLRLEKRHLRFLNIVGSSADGSLQACFQSRTDFGIRPKPPVIDLVLKPAKDIHVRVVDKSGTGISGARIGAIDYSGRFILAGVSDKDGNATLTLPADAKIQRIYVYKRGQGFDCKDYFGRIFRRKEDIGRGSDDTKNTVVELSRHSHTFVLDVVHRVRVRAVDQSDKLVAGITVCPISVSTPDRTGRARFPFHVSDFEEFHVVTDDRGVAEFDYIWSEFGPPTQFVTLEPGYCTVKMAKFDPRSEESDLVLRVTRPIEVGGTVRHANGDPAKGIVVHCSGIGVEVFTVRGMPQVRKSAVTDVAGRFSFQLCPKLAYMFVVDDDRWAAPFHDSIMLIDESSIGEVDFVLQPGTRVSGKVAKAGKDEFVANHDVALYQFGERIITIEGFKQRNVEHPTQKLGPAAERTTLTDAEGRFEFNVGPGKYVIAVPAERSKSQEFKVPSKSPLEFNFEIE